MLATVLVFRGVPQTYTYTIPPELESIQIGTHVTIPFGRSSVSGLIVDIEKQEAERILAQQNSQYKEQMMQKEYADKLKTMQYEEKNKNILATFMRIKN